MQTFMCFSDGEGEGGAHFAGSPRLNNGLQRHAKKGNLTFFDK